MSDFSDAEHFLTMIDGCESINAGKYDTPNAQYASTVLKMHANDLGSYAGQEGFLQGIKMAAKKTKDWFVAFIKAIIDFVTGNKKKAKDFEAGYKSLKDKYKAAKSKAPAKKEEKAEGKTETKAEAKDPDPLHIKTADIAPKIRKVAEMLKEIDGEKAPYIGYNANTGQYATELEKLADKAEEKETADDIFDLGTALSRVMFRVGEELDSANSKLRAWNESMDPQELGRVVMGPVFNKIFTNLGLSGKQLGEITSELGRRSRDALDKFMSGNQSLKL